MCRQDVRSWLSSSAGDRVGSTSIGLIRPDPVSAPLAIICRPAPAVTTSDSPAPEEASWCRYRSASPARALITVTVLAEPTTIVATAYPTEPTVFAGNHLVSSPGSVDVAGRAVAGRVDGPATARPRRDDPPVEGRDCANRGAPAGSGMVDAQPPVDSWPLRVGDPLRVEGYRLVSWLGSGGMADVFYAAAPSGGPVAVKILRAAVGAPQACQREYRLAEAVDAGCTAPPVGYGVSAVGAYLVTAYLPGYRCATTLPDTPMPASQLWAFGSALARVLAAVHARGVVHCDVKPANLLVRGEDVRLIDFGIARYVGERFGEDGTVQCSRGWAAPEQLRNAPTTPAVDIFAWGCVLAYLAGGVHPFASRDETEWILRVQSAEPDLFGVPAELAGVIRAALARDPRQRPDAVELAATCRAHGAAGPTPARRTLMARCWRAARRAGRWRRPHPTTGPLRVDTHRLPPPRGCAARRCGDGSPTCGRRTPRPTVGGRRWRDERTNSADIRG
jgi:Protein kinase domain